jgi:hypothetical protein
MDIAITMRKNMKGTNMTAMWTVKLGDGGNGRCAPKNAEEVCNTVCGTSLSHNTATVIRAKDWHRNVIVTPTIAPCLATMNGGHTLSAAVPVVVVPRTVRSRSRRKQHTEGNRAQPLRKRVAKTITVLRIVRYLLGVITDHVLKSVGRVSSTARERS